MQRLSKSFASVLAFLTCCATVGSANDGDIKIFFDPGRCAAEVPCGETRAMYVYAVLQGATAAGITGVEYSIGIGMDGAADAGWVFSEEFTAGATATLGTGGFQPPDEHAIQPRFVRNRGVNVAWGTCQTGSENMVLVETVQVTNSGCAAGELRLLVWSHDNPRNAFFRCPLAVLCDGPVYTKICLGSNVGPCTNPDGPRGPDARCSTSGEAVLNPTAHSQSPCAVTAVAPVTWTAMKGLYR